MSLVQSIQRTVIGRVMCNLAGLLLLFSPLAACGFGSPTATPVMTSGRRSTTINKHSYH